MKQMENEKARVTLSDGTLYVICGKDGWFEVFRDDRGRMGLVYGVHTAASAWELVSARIAKQLEGTKNG